MALQLGYNSDCRHEPPRMGSHMRMIGDELKQGTDLWRLARKTMMTGSQCGLLLHNGKHSYGNVGELTRRARLKPDEDDPEPEYTPPWLQNTMKYGQLHEDDARQEYLTAMKEYYKDRFPDKHVTVEINTECNFYMHREGVLMASPDGEVDITVAEKHDTSIIDRTLRGVLEFKCPTSSYFNKKRDAHPRADVTYAEYPDLLHSAKWSRQHLRKPPFDIGNPTVADDELYMQDPKDPFGPKGAFSQYYFQCISNLFLSGRDFIDFVVWTAGTPNEAGVSHRCILVFVMSS